MSSEETSNRIAEVSNLITAQLLRESAENATNLLKNVKAPDFSKLSYEEASKAVNSITSQNRQIVTDLLHQIVHGSLTPEAKTFALYLLGEMRSRDAYAVTVLIDNIDFKTPRVDNEWRVGRWGTYPAQEALVKTRSPFVYGIVNRLAVETNECAGSSSASH